MSTILNSTNQSASAWVREATIGTTPTSPTFQAQRLTQMGLKLNPKRERSKEIRSDGQAAGTYQTGTDNAGPIAGELSFNTFDDKFETAMKGVWAEKPVRDNVGTADSVITNVAATGGVVTCLTGASINVGHLALFGGFGQGANNGLFRCSTASATVPAFASQGLVDETAPAANARIKVIGFQGASGDITATSTGLGSTALDFTTLGINGGEWHWVGGAAAGNKFATAADGGWARVAFGGVAAHALTYDVLPSGWTTDNGASKAIQVFTPDFLKNGTAIYGYTWERRQLDPAGGVLYEYFRGQLIDKLSLPASAGNPYMVNMDWLGLSGDAMGTTRLSGVTDKAANSYETMTSFSHTLQLNEGGVSLLNGVNCISSSSYDIANNLSREQVEGGYAINVGAFTLTGKFEGYLGDSSIMAKSSANTPSSLSRVIAYASGNKEAYMLDAPYVRYTLTSDVPGSNQARKVSGTFDAEPHPTLGYTFAICRFWYRP